MTDLFNLDSLFTPSTGSGGLLRAASPNMNAFSPFPSGTERCCISSPKRARSPSTNPPSYQEALQSSLNVPATTTGSFTSDELLNGYHEHTSSVISSLPQAKLSSPSIEDSIGSPMRVDNDDIDLLQRSVLDTNGFRRNSFENFRTPNMQNNSIYHVNPCDIFGNPTDTRWIKQEGSELSFLDTGTAAAELAESMDFAMSAESMSGVTFSQ